jgi:hypothetical protein
MSPAGYYYARPPTRFGRALRTLVLTAAAALVGVVAGGVSVFAIVAALSAPPREDTRAAAAKVGAAAATSGPVSPTISQPAPAGPSRQQAAQQPLPQSPPAQAMPATQAEVTPSVDKPKPWPDALSRARHPAALDTPKPGQAAAAESASPVPAKQQVGDDRDNRKDNRGQDNKASASSSAERAAVSPSDSAAPAAEPNEPAKRRVVVTASVRQQRSNDKFNDKPNDKAAELPPNKPQLFDFFGDQQQVREEQPTIGPGQVAPRGATKPRSTWRRQDDWAAPDQAQRALGANSPRRRVIVNPAPANSDEQRVGSDGGFFGFLGPSGRDDWQ